MYTLKKSLGQHFLINEAVCKKIVSILQQNDFLQLLEVGPGGGALTKYLIGIPSIHFKAIEVDEEKVNYLLQTYPELTDKIIHQSFLEAHPPFEGVFHVVGNFPYNISTQILFKLLEWKAQVPVIVGMFQKEVAQRVSAAPGSKVYGVISVLLQAWYDIEYLFEVSEQSFNPPPKVKSGVIRLMLKPRPVNISTEKKFTTLVKAAFNQRRKKLRNAVKHLFEENELQNNIFDKRAEQLSVEDFASLSFKMI